EQAARELVAEPGIEVTPVAADINTVEGQAAVLAATPAPDILVANPGVRQTPADFRTLSRAEWQSWLDVHFLSSLDLIRGVVPGMAERRFGPVGSISVSFIKFPPVGFAPRHAPRLAPSAALAA